MRIFLLILTFLWLIFWVFIGVDTLIDTPKQIESDKIFVDKEIKPSVNFVTSFQTINKRLPTYREYYTWERDYYKDYSSDLTQKDDTLIEGLGSISYIRRPADLRGDEEKFKAANWNKDFAIGVWRGEWMEYYFSWNNSYDTNNYSSKDSIMSLLIYFILAITPLLLLRRRLFFPLTGKSNFSILK